MGATHGSTRLVTLVGAGPYRFALDAEEIRELAKPAAGSPLKPLLDVLGESSGSRGEWAIHLRGDPPPSFGVDIVEGVFARGQGPTLNLPSGIGLDVPELFHGAFLIGGALALELRIAKLHLPPPKLVRQRHAVTRTFAGAAPKALVITVAGRSLGFALPQVLAVVAKPVVCPVPRTAVGVRGVTLHGGSLLPVLDLGELNFDRPTGSDLGVLIEQAGGQLMVLADAVRGVGSDFRPVADSTDGWMEGQRGERALFLALDV